MERMVIFTSIVMFVLPNIFISSQGFTEGGLIEEKGGDRVMSRRSLMVARFQTDPSAITSGMAQNGCITCARFSTHKELVKGFPTMAPSPSGKEGGV